MSTSVYEELKNRVQEKCPDRNVVIREITKNNDIVLKAINILDAEQNNAPAIYLDAYANRIMAGEMTYDEAAADIITRHDRYDTGCNMDTDSFMRKEFIMENVSYKLVNAGLNEERLLRIPHKKYLDLAKIYEVQLSRDADNTASFIISNELMDSIGLSADELETAASINNRNASYTVKSMADTLREAVVNGAHVGFDIDEFEENCLVPMLIISKPNHMWGASSILREDILSFIADRYDRDLFIIPSSVHEILIVPDYAVEDPAELSKMVMEVNNTEVPANEILSYSAYRFSRKNKTVTIAA